MSKILIQILILMFEVSNLITVKVKLGSMNLAKKSFIPK